MSTVAAPVRVRRTQAKACVYRPGLIAASAAKSAAGALAALFTRPSLVDGQPAAFNLLLVQGGDGCLRLLVTAHLDKAEAFRAACRPVRNDLGRLDRAVRLEHVLQIAVGNAVGQISDVQLLAHFGASFRKTHARQRDPPWADADVKKT